MATSVCIGGRDRLMMLQSASGDNIKQFFVLLAFTFSVSAFAAEKAKYKTKTAAPKITSNSPKPVRASQKNLEGNLQAGFANNANMRDAVNRAKKKECHRRPAQRLQQGASEIVYHCGKGPKAFEMTCDMTTDPLEGTPKASASPGKGWIDVAKARWAQHGENFGLEGPFGFIACTRNVNSAAP